MSLFKNIMWSPSDYANAAVIAREAGTEMLARLEWMSIQPRVILDIGCGGGECSQLLQERYPQAQIIALDLSEPMLNTVSPQINRVCADTHFLPFKRESVDMIFANFIVPWFEDIQPLLREWRRLLRPDGLLCFSALGPDTLQEWRESMQNEHIPQFIDMHDIGDVMLQAGYSDPVLDVNHYTTSFSEQNRFILEMKASGMWFPPEMESAEFVPNADGKWEVTYEVVYAHAFAPAESTEQSASADGVVRIPLSHLRNQLRNR